MECLHQSFEFLLNYIIWEALEWTDHVEHLFGGEMRPEVIELITNTRSFLNIVGHFGNGVSLDKDVTVSGRIDSGEQTDGGGLTTAVLHERIILAVQGRAEWIADSSGSPSSFPSQQYSYRTSSSRTRTQCYSWMLAPFITFDYRLTGCDLRPCCLFLYRSVHKATLYSTFATFLGNQKLLVR